MYDRNPQMLIPPLQAMEDACGDTAVDAFHGWIRHARQYFHHARENTACAVFFLLFFFTVTVCSEFVCCFVCRPYIVVNATLCLLGCTLCTLFVWEK